MVAAAVLLFAWSAVTIASHVAAAASGLTLIFSQEAMDDPGVGPAPTEGQQGPGSEGLRPDETIGGNQYVDVPALALGVSGGAIAVAGAIWLTRRSRWSVPLGLAGMAVAAIVGSMPAVLGLSLADTYRLGIGEVSGLLVVGFGLAGVALAGALAIWRHRPAIGPASG